MRYTHHGNVPPAWYAGSVTHVQRDTMTVLFDNGDKDNVYFKGVRRAAWKKSCTGGQDKRMRRPDNDASAQTEEEKDAAGEPDIEADMARDAVQTDASAGGGDHDDVNSLQKALEVMTAMLLAARERAVPTGTKKDVLTFMMTHVLLEEAHCRFACKDPHVWLRSLANHTPASFDLLCWLLRDCFV